MTILMDRRSWPERCTLAWNWKGHVWGQSKRRVYISSKFHCKIYVTTSQILNRVRYHNLKNYDPWDMYECMYACVHTCIYVDANYNEACWKNEKGSGISNVWPFRHVDRHILLRSHILRTRPPFSYNKNWLLKFSSGPNWYRLKKT